MAAVPTYNDNELYESFKSGDLKAFRALYEKYWKPLFNFSFNILKEEQDAEDIVQEVFSMLWEKRLDIEVHNLQAFLMTACKHRILKQIDRSKVKGRYLESLSSHLQQANQEHLLIDKEYNMLFNQEVDKLPRKMKQIYLLRSNEELSYLEIAEKLSIGENTVRKQLHNARTILKAKLSALLSILIVYLNF
ncbi:RNA polymerase sigma-70 factor, ECF subfamily [Sphingobacterium nematocida]|uniref:RNA polymerase sigma-70 factor, ECF subfamily n=1 Tax=Sphingobacterium nematocida TaxID=1513896 RepID=A0A1T5GRE6_9SPHI|nr:RNA polymerase sigma-70 factor [Sphingobacterium nematocida]SKC10966.1 RNA polymerase sigma-70 factor, ECF subfamily [Sphingobacterium nematocida]